MNNRGTRRMDHSTICLSFTLATASLLLLFLNLLPHYYTQLPSPTTIQRSSLPLHHLITFSAQHHQDVAPNTTIIHISPLPSPTNWLNSSTSSADAPTSPIVAPSITQPLQKSITKKFSYQKLSSLQRLEARLQQARNALRKGLLEYNTSEIRDGFAVDGAVYRNAPMFYKSYHEMEKTLKVFVYPPGQQPLVHNGPCKEIYAVEGRFIQELQARNSFVTSDPNKAHVFFLPFSVSMLVTFLYKSGSKDMRPLFHFVRDYVDVVATKYRFWNRSQGADHFMLSCHDWAPHLSKAHPQLQKKAIRVVCNSNLSEGYVPSKDVSLPEINLIGGNIPAKLGGLAGNRRKYLGFFAGRDHGPVRPLLFKHWEGKDEELRVFQWLPPHLSYHELMKSSKFCICPGGYEVNSPRIVEAIYNDCIPVIIADYFVLPFNDVLDWQSFSIHLPERDIPNLKSILQAVPKEKYELMQTRVRVVRKHFLLNQPPTRYDAFHMILHSVWLRRLNVRLGGE